jgi:hypothetical protein
MKKIIKRIKKWWYDNTHIVTWEEVKFMIMEELGLDEKGAESLHKGMQQAARGETVTRNSFSQFVNDNNSDTENVCNEENKE